MKVRLQQFFRYIAVLISAVLLLTGCSRASDFYFSGSDDPLDLREIQQLRRTASLQSAVSLQKDGALKDAAAGTEDSGLEEIPEDGVPAAGPASSEDSAAKKLPQGPWKEESQPPLFYDAEYMEENYAMGAAVLDVIGWDLKTAYDWCASMDYYSETPDDAALGVIWFANFGFDLHGGNCYTYAAAFTVMARLLGYEARQVDGHILDFEYLHHSWVEIVVDGETYICDPEFEWQKNLDGYMKKYDDEGIWPLNTELITYMPDDPQPGSIEAIVERGWPAEPPYGEFTGYGSYLESADPNTGCVGDEVPFQ